MTTLTWHTRSRLRIIGAIAAKDVTEAIRNKAILSIFLGVAVLLLSVKGLPLLTGMNDNQPLMVYTQNRELLRDLRRYPGLSVIPAADPALLQTAVGETSGSLLGINLDQPLPAGEEPLTLTTYQVHWLNPDDAATAQTNTAAALSDVFDRPVELDMIPTYPAADSGGQPAMVAMTFMMILLAIGAALVPFLFIEEREGKTLDMLLISPATISDLVVAKALAGAVYVFTAAAVILILYNYLIVQWPVALATILVGGLMAVMIGLLFGVFIENQGTTNLFSGLILIILLALPLVEQFAVDRTPSILMNIIHWLPSTAIGRLLRLSMTTETSMSSVAPDLLVIAGFTLILFFLVVWRLRRSDR